MPDAHAWVVQEMEEELGKLVGMESVKTNMRKLCKQLSLDLRRRQQGHAVLDAIRCTTHACP